MMTGTYFAKHNFLPKAKLHLFIFIASAFISFVSCNKDPVPCTVDRFIGRWKVKNNIICDVDSTGFVEIWRGQLGSEILMKLGPDTLNFTVAACKATHASDDLGWVRTAQMTLDEDEIEFWHNQLVLLYWQTCSMTLVKK